MARPRKEQKSETTPGVEPDQVIEVVEEVIQDLENAMAGMDLAIAKLQMQAQGITRIVAAKQAVNGIIKNLKPYVG